LGVVGARDRTEVAGQHPTERGGEISPERIEGRVGRSVLLLDLAINLLIVGGKVEELVLDDRAAECDAELMLAEVGLEREIRVRSVRRQRAILPEIVEGAVQ